MLLIVLTITIDVFSNSINLLVCVVETGFVLCGVANKVKYSVRNFNLTRNIQELKNSATSLVSWVVGTESFETREAEFLLYFTGRHLPIISKFLIVDADAGT